MKINILIIAAIALPSNLLFAGPQSGQYRGYVAVQDEIRRNFFRSGSDFSLANLIGQRNPDGSLMLLIGAYESNGGRYINGNPNALSMVVWNMLAQSMSLALSQECGGGGRFSAKLNARAKERIYDVCQWADGKELSEEQAIEVWRLVVGFSAPKHEFENWKTYLGSLQKMDRAESTKNLWMSLLLHPYFLMDLN